MTDIEYFIKQYEQKVINNRAYYTFGYQKDYQVMENIDYGYVPFITSLNCVEVENIIPKTNENNRSGKIRESTEYIVVHDTASGAPTAGAVAHGDWLMSMANNPESTYAVSWHFTVDDCLIMQHLPLDEVGYHAGDGTGEKLVFTDTNVKALDVNTISISSDGFFIVNDTKTSILVPRDEEGNIPNNDMLPSQGVNHKVLENGNIGIGTMYYNKGYKKLANRGGNLNSIGIETCVNYGRDYITTMRITAYLVAKLLKHYNLGIDRVKQHNSFSGKDCPMTMRHNGMWEEFISLVSLNLFRMTKLSNNDISFVSLTEEYLDNNGKVLKHKDKQIIKYAIIIDGKEHIIENKIAPVYFDEE